MSAIMCQGAQVMALNSILGIAGGFTDGWLLKLFSNNVTPDTEDTSASYTEVSGGGYADIELDKDEFTVTPGDPSQALYNDFQDFTFTGATSGPGTIYGYYIVDGANNLIMAERFPVSQVPFVPVNGSLIRITPKITGASANT